MRQEFKPFVVNPYATGSKVKQALITNAGYVYVRDQQLVVSVSQAEGKNSLIIDDNNREDPAVLRIARKKALGLADYSRLISTFGGIYQPLVVNDTVWNFSFNHNQNRTRTLVNKPETKEEIEETKNFYREAKDTLAYSSAGLCVVTPDLTNPIPYSMLTKLRVGKWLGNIPESYKPNPNFSLGIDIITALKKGYIDPHGEMKFELIFFDDTELSDIRELTKRRQLNFEMRIPYTGTDENLNLIKSLSNGIVPSEIFEGLELKKEKKYLFPIL